MRKSSAWTAQTVRRRRPRSQNADLVVTAPLAVTVEQAAQMLHVHRSTLYKLVMRGELESFTVGRARRIAVSVLRAYVAGDQQQQSSAGA